MPPDTARNDIIHVPGKGVDDKANIAIASDNQSGWAIFYEGTSQATRHKVFVQMHERGLRLLDFLDDPHALPELTSCGGMKFYASPIDPATAAVDASDDLEPACP